MCIEPGPIGAADVHVLPAMEVSSGGGVPGYRRLAVVETTGFPAQPSTLG